MTSRASILSIAAIGLAFALIGCQLRSGSDISAESATAVSSAALSLGNSDRVPAWPAAPGAPARVVDSKPPAISTADLTRILECNSSGRCPRETVCWIGDDDRLGCFGSNCGGPNDPGGQCSVNENCMAISRRAGIYRCVRVGPMGDGQGCVDPTFASIARSCGKGLTCASGRCRRTCASDQECGGNDHCGPVNERVRACIPSCTEDDQCESGQTCLSVRGRGAKMCLRVGLSPSRGVSCRPDVPGSCPNGQLCEVSLSASTLIGVCRPSCSSGGCANGKACRQPSTASAADFRVCSDSCGGRDEECPKGEVCIAQDRQQTSWACQVAPLAARPSVQYTVARGSFADPVLVLP
jgi:hypothetical protein